MTASESKPIPSGAHRSSLNFCIDYSGLKRTVAGAVRSDLAQINASIAAGARIKDIYRLFTAQGMQGSLKSFTKAIERARKSARPSSPSPASLAIAQPVPAGDVGRNVRMQQAVMQRPGPAKQGVDLDQYFTRKSIFDRTGTE